MRVEGRAPSAELQRRAGGGRPSAVGLLLLILALACKPERARWMGAHAPSPEGLFAMKEAPRPATTPAAGVMRAVDDALFEIRGFPLAEHAELPYGNEKLVLDHTVVKVEQKNVPQSLLTI